MNNISKVKENAMMPSRYHPSVQSIPVFIGVTGHRIIRDNPGDKEKLICSIKAALGEFQKGYPHIPFVLLTALAQGCDQTAARAALNMGIKIAVVLPFSKESYVNHAKDFDAAAKQEFETLIGQAEFVYTIPDCAGESASEDERVQRQFRECSRFISDNSHAVLALWDGRPTDYGAGTAVAVKDSLHGRSYMSGDFGGVVIPEARPIYHIFTPRENDPVRRCDYKLRRIFPDPLLETGNSWFYANPDDPAAGEPANDLFDIDNAKHFTRRVRNEKRNLRPRMGESRALLDKIEAYNKDLIKKRSFINKDRYGYEMPDLSERASYLEGRFEDTDRLALWNQKIRFRLGWLIIFLAGLGYASLCVFSDLLDDDSPWFLGGYIGIIVLAGALWLGIKYGKYHEKYTDYRTLAEGLRVQGYWFEAGVYDYDASRPALVPDAYLRRQKSNLEWIRFALRGWNLYCLGMKQKIPDNGHICEVAKIWIGPMDRQNPDTNEWAPVVDSKGRETGQAGYYKRRQKDFGKKERQYNLFITLLLVSSFALACWLLMHIVLDSADHNNIWKFIIGLLPVWAMVLSEISEMKDFEGTSKRYAWYHKVFKRTVIELDEIRKAEESGRLTDEKALDERIKALRSIGKEALRENADWAAQNSERVPTLPN